MSANHDKRFAKYEELLKNADHKVLDLEIALSEKLEEIEQIQEKMDLINEESV